MRIIKLHIENFGKLSNFDLDFNNNINEIYKENGWGKSTLTAFIKSMFYSMPARARGEDFKFERPRFYPWQGGKYGGYLEYETDEGKTYRVTRFFEKTPEGDFFELKDLQSNQILTYEDERLGDVLFGLGRESFEVTALFPQLNFVSLSTVQITANLTGLNKFQNDMENLDRAVKIIDSKILSIKKEKPRKDEVDLVKRQIVENETLLNEQKEKQNVLKQEYEEIKKQESDLSSELSEENKQFELLSSSFNRKISLQEEITKENEKLNEFLSNSNLLKDKKLGEKGRDGNSRLKFFIPIPFALVALSVLLFTLIGVMNFVVGITISVVFLLLAVASIVVVVKLRKDKNTSSNLKDIDRQIKDNDEQIKIVQKNINTINEQLKLFDGVNTPSREKLDSLENQSMQLKLQGVTAENDLLNVTENIDKLIEINEKLVSDKELMSEKQEKLDWKINILQSTKDYLLSAKENVSKRFIVPVNEKLKEVLSKFNFAGRDYVVDTSWKVKENTNFGTKDFEYSSQGLKDIISFCQRINLIQDVYKKEKPIIILDDTFVNLDDQNLMIAKEIVREISNEYQILYICCNERCMIAK